MIDFPPPTLPVPSEKFSPGPVQDHCIQGKPRKPSLIPFNPLGLPEPLTLKQHFYIWGIQGIGAAIIDGAANFGIATAMYRSQNEVSMWILTKSTVAGDLAVTIFIQGILTFVIASSMVHVDLRKNTIDAFPYPWPDTQFGVVPLEKVIRKSTSVQALTGNQSLVGSAKTKHGRIWRTFHQRHGLGRGLHFFSGSATNDLFDTRLKMRDFFDRLFWSVWKGSLLSVLYFLILWPISIAIVHPLWGDKDMAHTWIPPLIKLVYGFVFGLLQNPIVACIALGSEDAVRAHRREVRQRLVHEFGEGTPPFNTLAEQAASPIEASRF